MKTLLYSSFIALCMIFLQTACQSEEQEENTSNDQTNINSSASEDSSPTPSTKPIKEPEDILEYFNALPPEAKNANYSNITNQGGGFIIHNISDTSRAMPVSINKTNGYLKFNDSGTGGGTYSLEAVYFAGSDKRRFIGINQAYFDGVSKDNDLHFWEYIGEGIWQEATEEIWEKFTPQKFLEDGYKAPLKEKELQDLLPINYTLPLRGSEVIVNIYLGKFAILCKVKEDEELSEEIENVCRIKKKVKQKRFVMRWNQSKNKFEIK